MTMTMKDLVADARSRVAAVSPHEAETAVRKGDLIEGGLGGWTSADLPVEN